MIATAHRGTAKAKNPIPHLIHLYFVSTILLTASSRFAAWSVGVGWAAASRSRAAFSSSTFLCRAT